MTSQPVAKPPIRVGIVCDHLEEGWASMDLVAAMILDHLARHQASTVAAAAIRPEYRHRFTRWPAIGAHGVARNADRLLNRFRDYPRALARMTRLDRFDLFHVVDHSYAQLVHALPADRTVVTCHDLDTFRCLLDPRAEPRPRWFRAMTRRILDGLCRAAAIACDSEATRRALLGHDLVDPERTHVVYLAVDAACRPEPDPEADATVASWLGPPPDPDDPPELLHVGSNIPRKRVDVLLETLAGVRRVHPGTRLIKVGGALTGTHAARAKTLGLADGAIVALPYLDPRSPRDRAVLAAVYRRAAIVLQPSDAEGFGLPVAEGPACGTVVLASNIDVLREVGGPAAAYAPVGDVPAWIDAVLELLAERRDRPADWQARRTAANAYASRFRWETHVEKLREIYERLV